MKWSNLITDKRVSAEPRYRNEIRSSFEIDCDKILFSSPFRRLKDKTQVFPLVQNDIAHNRLTHTLEVANTGFRLGRIIGRELKKRYSGQLKEWTENDIGSIVRAGCLIHDIGNPPFGHAGEKGISEYFQANKYGHYLYNRYYSNEINKKGTPFTAKQYEDLENFEGNAQGFRIVTNQNYKSLNITYTSIAASIKYPRESLIADSILKLNKNRASCHKYGFFQSEKRIFLKIAKHLQLKLIGDNLNTYYLRHPLAFVVESADDICNLLIDLEDSVKMNLIEFEPAEAILSEIAKIKPTNRLYNTLRTRNEKLAFLRQGALHKLIEEAKSEFLKNEVDIRNGKYDEEIVSNVKSKKLLKAIKILRSENTFCCRSVITREATGYEVLYTLISYLTDAVNSCEECVRSSFHKDKIKSLIPNEYTFNNDNDEFIDTRNRLIIDYISGMTDNYALNLFKSLKGIEIKVL